MMRFLLIPFLFLISFSAQAHSPRSVCVDGLTPDLRKLSNTLESIPNLRQYIFEMMQDPNVSEFVKKLIRRSLIDTQTEIVAITEELREAWNIEGAVAFAVPEHLLPHWAYEDTKTSNEAFTNRVRTQFHTSPGIAVPDGTSAKNLMTLIHELAHIRFNAFIFKHYDEICRRLPRSFAVPFDGKCLIGNQFLELVSEKHAYETQYRILGKVWKDYFPDEIENRMLLEAVASPKNFSSWIGEDILDWYLISPPEVRALASLPIHKILLGGKCVQEVHEAMKLYNDETSPLLPESEEVPMALMFIKIFWRERGIQSCQPYSFIYFGAELLKLSKLENGVQRANRLLLGIIQYAGKLPETQSRLLKILNLSDAREALKTLGWRVPVRREINWRDLTSETDSILPPPK